MPLHTFVVLDPSLLTRKTRELKQQAQLVLTAYQREHMANMEPVLTDEFGFEHQVFTTHEIAQATMFLTEEELNTDNQGYHKLSRKQLYHVINRQSIINLLTGTNSLY